MSNVINEVRTGTYLDSVALMRLAREIAALAGIAEAGLMLGTPANLEILAAAGLLANEGRSAGPADLVIAVRAESREAGMAGIAKARDLLDRRQRAAAGHESRWIPRSLRAALESAPDTNLALISVPGAFATAEAGKALRCGLDVMIFSDNVALDDEVALKREAARLGRIVMGPDCGTAIIAGIPLGFANLVPRGDIGLIGASGTGMQEVSCLIAKAGYGITHAIGTGGRDLKSAVGGITTLAAIDLLDADPATRHVVLVSKPADADVAARIAARLAQSPKSFTVCMLGTADMALPSNARAVATLEEAAHCAVGADTRPAKYLVPPIPEGRGRLLRGLFAGGTLCAEAQLVGLGLGHDIVSNVPVPGARGASQLAAAGHRLIDFGDDAYTRGRPHPMIEPAVRDEPLREAIADREVGVVLLDVVLGLGGHMDPAGAIASVLAAIDGPAPLLVASVTGTPGDPQDLHGQVAALEAAGVVVAPSNAAAARLAFGALAASVVA